MRKKLSIYIIAICGTGMSALAGLLKESGHDVSGSDANIYPPVSTLLAKYGILVKPGYNKQNVPESADLIIIGNAVSKNNEEVQAVLGSGIRYVSFPQALGELFLDGKKSLVVVGTHGKTTTTSLLSWVLHDCGWEPGFLVGGWLKNFDSNYRLPTANYFVVEGDEYDTAFFDKEPKFLHYRPSASILTGIEFDHADIYQNLDQIISGFRKYVKLMPSDGFLLVGESGTHTHEVISDAPCNVETYGFSHERDWIICDYRFQRGMSEFSLVHQDKEKGRFQLPMVGQHNARNGAAVAAMALKLGMSAHRINKAFSSFAGVKRRQEVVGEERGVTVIDDFAHHPTAIHQTLEGIKRAYEGSRIWAVFEPRSATSRRNTFQGDFPDSFRLADKVIVSKLFSPYKIKPEDRLDLGSLVGDIKKTGKEAYLIPEVKDIIEIIAQQSQPKDVVLIMSSGGFSDIHLRLLDRLSDPNA